MIEYNNGSFSRGACPARAERRVHTEQAPRLNKAIGRALLFAWLLASLLFAHGCHGDGDNELFAALVRSCIVHCER
jgi:hypothetical protein